MTQAANYRLVFVHPEPERDERVCVGVMFEDRGKVSVLYDEDLSKARCIAPDLDRDLMQFYLSEFRSRLESSREFSIDLQRFAPFVSVSAERVVATPIADSLKLRLLDKYARPRAAEAREASSGATHARDARLETIEHMEQFVQQLTAQPRRIHRNVTARMLGIPGKRIAPVALGVETTDGYLLVDGIDLRTMTPAKGIRTTNKLVHTFWQYARVREHEFLPYGRFKTVGVVLNGIASKSNEYSEAHDYALDQFRKEADLTIDSASTVDTQKLAAALQ